MLKFLLAFLLSTTSFAMNEPISQEPVIALLKLRLPDTTMTIPIIQLKFRKQRVRTFSTNANR